MEIQLKRLAKIDPTLGPLCSLAARRENSRLNGARLLLACELLYFPSFRACFVCSWILAFMQSESTSSGLASFYNL